MASRLGPIHAVQLLLNFHADPDLRTERQQTAADIALEFHQAEALALLRSWPQIQRQCLQTDFRQQWHRHFRQKAMTDDAEETSALPQKSAVQVLAALRLEEDGKQMTRDEQQKVLLDDPLLRKDLIEGSKVPGPLRPWEPGWTRFAKSIRYAKLVELETKLTAMREANAKPTQAQQQRQQQSHPSGDRPLPLMWSQKAKLREEAAAACSQQQRKQEEDDNEEENEKESFATSPPSQAVPLQVMKDLFGEGQATAAVESAEQFSMLPPVEQRRRQYAGRISTDAKFLRFSKRLASASALGIPLRTVEAPLEGTAEAQSVLRQITSQGPDFDLWQRYRQRDRLAELLQLPVKPSVDALGAYNQAVQFAPLNERDALWTKLCPTDDQPVVEPISQTAAALASSLAAQPTVGRLLDLATKQRPRYVESRLLPAKKEWTAIETLIQTQTERQEAAHMKKLGLGNAQALEKERLALEEKVLQQAEAGGEVSLKDGEESQGRPFSRQQRRRLAEKQEKLRQLFLRRPGGAGRYQALEMPWTSVTAVKNLPAV